MNLQELIKKHYGEDEEKLNTFLEEMKTNKIYTSSEENLDTRYSKLKGDYEAKMQEHEEATKLIEQLKASSKGNEELQGKINEYENQVATLQKELETTKIESALKVALVNAKATDIDYLTFKIKEKGEEFKLDEDGNIKGLDERLKEVKTAYPNFFEGEKKKEIDVKEIGKGEVKEPEPANLTEALMQEYAKKNNEM